jgi:HAD superfamily hydrolase (TIGR01509 family)
MDKLRAVLFDLDDTLFDWRLASMRGLAALQAEHPALAREPLKKLEQELWELVQTTHAGMMDRRMSAAEIRQERFRRLFAVRGVEIPAGQAELVHDLYREAFLESQCTVPGVPELLRELRESATVGVVTNNLSRREQEMKVRACGLDGLVDFIVVSEEVSEPKPGRGIFEAALARAGCRANEAVMVGDSWEMDVMGAVRIGIRAVWFNRRDLLCTDPSLATELRSFEPLDTALGVVLRSTSPTAH